MTDDSVRAASELAAELRKRLQRRDRASHHVTWVDADDELKELTEPMLRVLPDVIEALGNTRHYLGCLAGSSEESLTRQGIDLAFRVCTCDKKRLDAVIAALVAAGRKA